MGVLRLAHLNIKPQTIFSKGFSGRWFITDDGPELAIEMVSPKDWPATSILQKMGHKAVMIGVTTPQPSKSSLLRKCTN